VLFFHELVLLLCVGVIISHVGCATLHIGVIISCWCYYFSHWYYCFVLVVVLHIDGVVSRIGVVSSHWCCYFMLVLLLCNSQVPFGLNLIVIIFELVLLFHIGVFFVSLVSLVFPPILPDAS
jgi:hypothetical protein